MTSDERDLLGDDAAITVGDFVLRPLAQSDAAELLHHFAAPEVVEFMDIDPLEDIGEALGIIAWSQRLRAQGGGLRWAVRQAASGAFLGTCGFNSLAFERGRRGEVAYDLAAAWWGRGVMAALMPALVDFGFRRLGLHRLEAMVTPGNHRSCRLLERHGFRREGVLRGYGFWKGAYQDQIVYARLASGGA